MVTEIGKVDRGDSLDKAFNNDDSFAFGMLEVAQDVEVELSWSC